MFIKTKTHRKHLFTPLRYPGGKTSLFEFFDQIIKTNYWRDVVYIEPYAGGAGAALSLLLLEKVESIVINDFDPAIYAFWKSIINETDAFVEKINSTPATVVEWKNQKKIYNAKDLGSRLELGFATFFLNRTNRSGIMNGGPIGGKDQMGNWKIDARYNRKKLVDRIKLIALYEDRVTVLNQDGNAVIRKYAKNPQSFFYVDPPYYEKGADLYLNSFKHEHHERLAKTLNNNPSAKWILTYDNNEEIIRMYPERRQEIFSLKYSAHHASVGSEVMIFSDMIKLPHKEA